MARDWALQPRPEPRPEQRPRQRRRPSLIGDIWRGAVLGDFSREIGLAGAVTQIGCGFVPGIGTVCAVRDLFADWRHHDRLGVALNVVGLLPVFGGVAKTADVLHRVRRLHRALFAPRPVAADEESGPAAERPA